MTFTWLQSRGGDRLECFVHGLLDEGLDLWRRLADRLVEVQGPALDDPHGAVTEHGGLERLAVDFLHHGALRRGEALAGCDDEHADPLRRLTRGDLHADAGGDAGA